jgi:predicted nucleic acid-binding protein
MKDEAVFFDTDILVYANDTSGGIKRETARKLISHAMTKNLGSVSTQVLSEFWVTVTQKLPVPLDRRLAERELALLAAFNVVGIDVGLVLSSVKIQERHQLSYWDAQIVATAALSGSAILYSEDLRDGAVYEGVKVVNPFASVRRAGEPA